MNKKLNNKTRVYLIATIISVAIVSMGIALAYFAASIQGTGSASLNVNVSKEPVLSFSKLDEGFILNAGVDNFTLGGDNLYTCTSSSATLSADSAVSSSYNVYFYIPDNEFVYTSEEKYPELILVLYVNGEVYTPTSIDTVTYNEVTGIDITTYSGIINIAEDYNITIKDGNTSEVQEWTAELYLINLDSNQIENTNKTFEGYFFLGKMQTLRDSILINNGGGANDVETALSYIESKGTPDFSKTATTNEGMFSYIESYNELDSSLNKYTYYFRGAIDNNWVIFGEEDGLPIYWRIIRIDGDGNIKLIYSGTTAPTEEDSVVFSSDSTKIDASYFNSSSVAYTPVGAGYVYSLNELHGSDYDSLAKQSVDNWFTNTLSDYVESLAQTDYCINRAASTSLVDWETDEIKVLSDYDSGALYYESYYLLSYKRFVQLECTDSRDILNLYSGLISGDEVALAGSKSGYISTGNRYFYLYTGYNYWTITPAEFNSAQGAVRVMSVYDTGAIAYNNLGILYEWSIRPTISISSEAYLYEGDGTWDNPYQIIYE